MSQAAHYHHAARSLLFSAHPGGTSSPTSILLLSIYLFSSQRPLAANVVIEVTRTCQTENNCSFMKTISCTPHRHISYLHVLRPLRTYCSAATRLYNKIVALVSLIVTEVGLVQGPQPRQPLNFGALTTRQFTLPTYGPMRREVRWMMARPIDCPTTHQSLDIWDPWELTCRWRNKVRAKRARLVGVPQQSSKPVHTEWATARQQAGSQVG